MGEDGSGGLQRVDLLSLGSIEPPVGLGGIGIGREQGREFLAAFQGAVVSLQEAALRSSALKRVAASHDVKLKDYRARKVQTLFGTVSFRIPRIIDRGRIETVLPIPGNGRSTQEFDELRAKLSAWMSFRSAMNLLAEMYPVDGGVSPSTALRQIAKAANGMESCSRPSNIGGAPVSLPMDTTFIRARETGHRSCRKTDLGLVSPLDEDTTYHLNCRCIGSSHKVHRPRQQSGAKRTGQNEDGTLERRHQGGVPGAAHNRTSLKAAP